MALAAIAQCFVSNVSAHGGGFNAEHSRHDRSAIVITAIVAAVLHRAVMLCRPTVAPMRIAPLRVARYTDVFVNCAAAHETGVAPVRYSEPG